MDFGKIDFSKMSTEEKLVRGFAAGSGALLILLFAVRGFGDGVERTAEEPAPQETETAAVEEDEDEEEAAPEEEDVAEDEAAEEEPADEDTQEAREEDAVEEDPEEVAEDAAAEDFEIAADADLANGASLWTQCSACHVYDSEQNRAGPHLVNIVGRDVAAVDDWSYSQALSDYEGPWTPEALDAWLEDPDDYIPGNQMAYGGISDADDRSDLIAYLYSQRMD